MVLSWLRKLRNVAVLFMVTITLLVAWPVYAASDVSRAHDRPLRLAIVNTYGQILSNIYYGESLKKIRAAIAPRPLEIRIYGPDTFLDAARNDQFDMSIASYGLTSIMLRQTGGARVLTAVNKRFPDPYAGNGAAIIVRSDRQDINTIEDLPNKSLAVMSITAFAGWQVPMAELTALGIDVKRAFRDIRVTGEPMTQILDLVHSGEADVGFVVNCLLEDAQALGKYKVDDFKVIGDRGAFSGSSCKHSTRLYPNWSFSIKPQMSPDESKAVVMALLSIPASEDISVNWTLTPDGTGADAVFQQLNLPYAEAYGLRDLLLEYSGVAFGVLVAVLVLIVNIVVLTVAVRIRTKQTEKALAAKMQSDLDARRAALKLCTMEKLSAVGTLSSMAAHELKQPLTVVNNYAGSLRRRLMRSEVPRDVLIEALTEIEESGLKAAEVIDLVRGYATNKERTFVRTDLAMTARHVLERNRKYGHLIHPDFRLGTYVQADTIELELVLTNLLKNAVAAVADVELPRVEFKVWRDETYAYASIADNGKPLTDEQFAQIGQIGRTTKKNGMGMGLAIVKSLLEAHSGALRIERLEPCGICCTVRLPLDLSEDEAQNQ